jgi:hypothetical protein
MLHNGYLDSLPAWIAELHGATTVYFSRLSHAKDGACVATCEHQETTTDFTGAWRPWQRCGQPAAMAPNGERLCVEHLARFWRCASCEYWAEHEDELRWDPDANYFLCAVCHASLLAEEELS